MKKTLAIVAGLLVFASGVKADMWDTDFAIAAVSTNATAKTVTLRGELHSVYVDVAAGSTGTVTVASAQGTLFTKTALTTDTWFHPRVVEQTTAGVNITEVIGSDTNTASYGKAAMAGPITVTVTQETAATNTATYNIKLIYKK